MKSANQEPSNSGYVPKFAKGTTPKANKDISAPHFNSITSPYTPLRKIDTHFGQNLGTKQQSGDIAQFNTQLA